MTVRLPSNIQCWKKLMINQSTQKNFLEVLSGVLAKINLIPFNKVEGIPFRCSPVKSIDRFREILVKGGIISTTRKTRGNDINAACGQLAGFVKPRLPKRHSNSSWAD